LYNVFGKDAPIPTPRIYVALPVTENGPGMIVMEDMSERASIPPSVLTALTYEQALIGVLTIARLHAWSLTTQIDWKTQMTTLKYQDDLQKMFSTHLPSALKVTKEKYPDQFGSTNVDELLPLVKFDHIAKIFYEHREFMDDVLVHGDYHMYNILFEKNEDGTVSDRLAAVVDFQAAKRGSPAADLAHFLNFSVSHELRRQHEYEFLRRYYDEVKSLAGDKFAATFDQILRIYEREGAMEALVRNAWSPAMVQALATGEGEEWKKAERIILDRLKAGFEDKRQFLDLSGKTA